jgi:probable phosphoglycerate mutase
MTTFLLIRHADNDFLGKALAGRLPGVHLNAVGRRQAEALAERLGGQPIHALYTSPRERARETAEPLARRLGLEPRVAPELDEIDYGEWVGKSLAELEALPAWRRLHACRSCNRAPGGETTLEVQARVIAFLARLCGECFEQTVALFSHADPIKSALCFYLGIPLDICQRLEISPASVTAVAVGADGPRVLYVNQAPAAPL